MPTFAIYKMLFKQASQRSLLAEDGTRLDYAQEYLEEILDKDLPISKKGRDQVPIRLENYPEARRDRVTLMVVCNEKKHKYQEKKENKELEYHPGCYVIIDNREGIAQVAIERSESFNGNPDMVRKLLQEALCMAFRDKGIEVELRPKMREREFWELVDEQRIVHQDTIKKVVFEFPNPEKTKPVDIPDKMKKNLAYLNIMTAATNAAKGSLQLFSDKGSTIQLERTKEDFAQLVTLCSWNGYDISVHFNKYGVFRCGGKAKALDIIKDSVITEFLTGQMQMGKTEEGVFELVRQLDEIRVRTENYIDDEPIKQVRKRRRKKQIR